MAKKKTDSRLYRFVEMVWENGRDGSWERYNHSLFDALTIAVKMNFEIHEGDFAKIADRMRVSYWLYNERIYRTAVEAYNNKACQEIERYLDRPAFRFEKKRLFEGSQFMWDGEYVTVTSIRKDDLTACSYQSGGRKVKRRYRLTREQLKGGQKAHDKKS